MKNKLKVQDIVIPVSKIKQEDFISLTDMARYKNAEYTGKVIQQWLRSSKTIDFLGLWEEIHNPNFKVVAFESIKNQTGSKNFSLSVKDLIAKTNAIGIISKAGRYGGTYAHKDIALEFERWLKSIPNNKPDGLYIIKTGSYYQIGITQDIESTIKNERVTYFSQTGGSYNFIIGILAKNVLEFQKIFQKSLIFRLV